MPKKCILFNGKKTSISLRGNAGEFGNIESQIGSNGDE
jgi:hypothetical protein